MHLLYLEDAGSTGNAGKQYTVMKIKARQNNHRHKMGPEVSQDLRAIDNTPKRKEERYFKLCQ